MQWLKLKYKRKVKQTILGLDKNAGKIKANLS